MDIFIYIVIFFLGTVFGSFFTLAVYRIPLNKDITHERSFCPKCNHRLEFLDLIPIWSYIFLKGKCRYCGQKVRPRYLILEILSGIVFFITYFGFRISNLEISYLYLGINYNNVAQKIVLFTFFILFYITNALIIGIDNEYKNINKKVMLFGILFLILYLFYLIVFMKIYYLFRIFAIILLVVLYIFNYKKENYVLQNIVYLLYILSFIDINSIGIFSAFFIVIYTIYLVYNSTKKSELKNTLNQKIPIRILLGNIRYYNGDSKHIY